MEGINALIKNNSSMEKMLTPEDVMRNLHIKDRRTFNKLITEKKLPHIKVGRTYAIPLTDYNRWIKNNTIG